MNTADCPDSQSIGSIGVNNFIFKNKLDEILRLFIFLN